MRHPRLVFLGLAIGLFVGTTPVVSAASKSQTVQVLVIIPELPPAPQETRESQENLARERVTTTFRDGDRPTLLYTYTEPN